jgi:hypothetical protein
MTGPCGKLSQADQVPSRHCWSWSDIKHADSYNHICKLERLRVCLPTEAVPVQYWGLLKMIFTRCGQMTQAAIDKRSRVHPIVVVIWVYAAKRPMAYLCSKAVRYQRLVPGAKRPGVGHSLQTCSEPHRMIYLLHRLGNNGWKEL